MALIERNHHIEHLHGLLASAKSGRGRMVFLGGEAGVGKTSLVREAVRLAGSTRALWGACDPLTTPSPLGPVMDFAEAAGGELSLLLQNRAPRESLFQALLKAIREGESPTFMVFDDLHWADEATFDLIRFLGRRLFQLPALVVATYRTEEAGPRHPITRVMGDLATAEGVSREGLEPLSRAGVESLAKRSGVDPAELYRRTGGNPFFVTEVLAGPNGSLPSNVRDAVLARVARLSDEARRALEAAAILGPRLKLGFIEMCAKVKHESVEACEEAGLLVRSGEAIEFRHELAREALRASLPASERQVWHAAALHGLEQWGSMDLAAYAHHAEGAGSAKAVLKFAPAAAREAAGLHAHREAAAQYARAIRFSAGRPGPERAVLLESQAYESYLTGLLEESLECRRAALALRRGAAEAKAEGDNLRWISRICWYLGRRPEAEQYAREAVKTLEPLPPGPELAMAWSNLSQLCMLESRYAEAIQQGEAAIALARDLENPGILSHALNNVGTAKGMLGGGTDWADLEESLRLARQSGLEEHVIRAYMNLFAAPLRLGDLPRGERWLHEGLEYATERDLEEYRNYMLGWFALVELWHGQWKEAQTLAGDLLRKPNISPVSRIQALVALGILRSRKGEQGAGPVLDEALALAISCGEAQRLIPVRAARAEAAFLAGDPVRAAEEIRACGPEIWRKNDDWLLGSLAYWGSRESGGIAAPPKVPEPWRALLAGDLESAEQSFRELGFPYETAWALSIRGDEPALREGLEIFERLGARPAASATAKRLRSLGIRNVPRLPRASTQANKAGLTSREIEVLDLIAEGLRNAEIANRLFVSTKTVGHHVSAILHKIGVCTRTEAARWRAGDPQTGGPEGLPAKK